MAEGGWGATEMHRLDSREVDDEFDVMLARCGEEPTFTLVVTDGDGLFGLTVDTVRMMQLPGLVPDCYVVGIGYPDADSISETVQIRARDLTPTRSTMFHLSGGADHFASFLANELAPWLAQLCGRAADDLAYFGHSLGGLFGTYLLLTEPGIFRRYILSSPSLWWDREIIFDIATSDRGTRPDERVSVFFGIGSLETDEGRRLESQGLPDDHPGKPPPTHLDMVADLERFVELLGRTDPSLDLRAVVLADEFHATVPGVVLTRALRHFHRPIR